MIKEFSLVTVFFASSFADVDAGFLLKLLIALSAAVVFANQVKNLVTKVPNPRDFYATKKELQGVKTDLEKVERQTNEKFKEVEKDIEKVESEMRSGFSDLNKAGELRAIQLHKRINEILIAIGKLQGQSENGKKK